MTPERDDVLAEWEEAAPRAGFTPVKRIADIASRLATELRTARAERDAAMTRGHRLTAEVERQGRVVTEYMAELNNLRAREAAALNEVTRLRAKLDAGVRGWATKDGGTASPEPTTEGEASVEGLDRASADVAPTGADLRERAALKRCPFCGGKAEFVGEPGPERGGYFKWVCVGCEDCDATGANEKSYEEATESWNCRALPTREEPGEPRGCPTPGACSCR